MTLKPTNRSVTVAFYLILIVFVVLYTREIDYSGLRSVRLSWPDAISALVLLLAYRYWSAFIWLDLLKALGLKRIEDPRMLLYVYAKSWLGRYVPGKVTWVLGKIYFASAQGIPKTKLAVSSLLEGALQTLVVFVMSFLLLAFDPRLDVLDWRLKAAMLSASIVIVIAMLPANFNKAISFAYGRFFKKPFPVDDRLTAKLLLRGVRLYAIAFFIGGLAQFFMVRSVYPALSFTHLLFIMGSANMAGALGIIAFFAPAGIGVREAVQLVFLSLIIPKEAALLVVICVRIWTLVADLLFFLLSKVLLHFRFSKSSLPTRPPA